jgi:DNA ligase (NAD+)
MKLSKKQMTASTNSASSDKEALYDLYTRAKKAYYDGEPIIPDEQFDALEQLLLQSIPDLVSRQIGAPARGKKVQLPVPMGSLDQVHNQDELSRWEAKYPAGTKLILTEKIDGNSALVQYEQSCLTASFSRGDGVMGANNLRHLSKVPSIPHKIPQPGTVLIRGEVVVEIANWETNVLPLATNRAGTKYANSRNFVAGFLNGKQGDLALYKFITFVAYEIVGSPLSKSGQLAALANWGFITPATEQAKTTEHNYQWYETLIGQMIANSAYELDGVVIDVDDPALRETEIDLDNLNPSHARKLKLVSQSATTTVREVQWNVSKDGYLKPLVVFDPIELVGAVITKATGHNARNIADLGIGPGAVIKVIRSGEVIPKIVECVSPVDFEQPENSVWNSTGADLVIDNDDGHPDVLQRQFEHFYSTIGVEFIGAGNIAKLIDAGVLGEITDTVLVSSDELESVLGAVGSKAAASIAEKLTGIEPAKLIAAFDVLGRGVGTRKIRALIAAVGLDSVLSGSLTIDQISAVDGFDTKTGEKIIAGIPALQQILSKVDRHYTFAVGKKQTTQTRGKFSGQVFCPTGVRFRPDQITEIESQGGTVSDSFTSSVTTLVAKDPNSTSSKVEKAKAKGIAVISLAQFNSLF